MNINNYLLVLHWLNNVIDNKLNDEILLIVLNSFYQGDENAIKKFEKIINLDINIYNYKIFDIKEIESINKIKKTEDNTNIILLGHPSMNINKILNSNTKVLLSVYSNLLECNLLKTKTKELRLSKETINIEDELEINEWERLEHYIEKKDPQKVIYSNNYNFIYKSIFSIFLKEIYNNFLTVFYPFSILQSNQTTFPTFWKDQIEEDILILKNYKILTSRLAVAIYRSCTLSFFDSNTKIGLFYYDKLRIKAKTTQLPIQNRQKVKAYDLNKTTKSIKKSLF